MQAPLTTALVLLFVGSAAADPALVLPTSAPDDPTGFWNILPPGEEGNANLFDAGAFFGSGQVPPHFDDQVEMYDRLPREHHSLTAGTIEDYFKRASFAVPPDCAPVKAPNPNVLICRDAFGVAHIHGETDRDVVWGAGYVSADDRMFFSDVLRHLGRARLSEFLGASQSNLALDRDVARVAGYTEEELQFQIDQMPRKFGALGELSVQSFRAFTEGMNAWILEALADPAKLPAEYPALQLPLAPWKETDVVAAAILVQAVFAVGGGGELANAALRQQLAERFPGNPIRAERLYRDLLVREDPEAPVTMPGSFPYLASPSPAELDSSATAIPDAGSVEIPDPLETLRRGLARMGIPLPGAMSNWLAVRAPNAEGGRPIGVMGPQTGYFAPEILMELSLHGPNIHARGAAFPGISLAVLLGRGIDFAWSATSGGSDLVDIRIEKLCEPGGMPTRDSTHYVLLGVCTPTYRRTDRFFAKPSAGSLEPNGLPAEPTVVTHVIERTVHGPVIGRATVGGQPVAIAYERSTWFGEIDSSPAFFLLNTNQVSDPQSFFTAMNYVSGSFNWLYVDEKDAAFFHSGLYPKRLASVDPELPTWGTGQWEWQGFLSRDEHPHAVLGSEGPAFMTSWNNKPARDWHASDANYSFGTIHRSQMLDDELHAKLAGKTELSVVDMIQAMASAATVDLRATKLLPLALDPSLLGSRPEVSGEVALLDAWLDAGAHRIDVDRDGHYEHEAAIALLDEWYDRLLDATVGDELAGLSVPQGRDDHNRLDHLGSSFQGGWYHWVQKSLRQALGQAPAEPLDEIACGDGTAASCAAALVESLQAAVAALTQRFGADPWRAPKSTEEIRFSPVGVVSLPPIDWQNRPTFQQVVQPQRARLP